MSVTEKAEWELEFAREALVKKLSDATTPGIDLIALVDVIDDYIVARVRFMKLDF